MDEDKRRTAFHEAAHAVAQYRFGFTCAKVTIVPDEDRETLGSASRMDSWESWEEVPEDVCHGFIIMCLAGFATGLHLAPDQREAHLQQANSDFAKAARLLRLMEEMGESDPDDAIPDRWIEETSVFVDREWRAITAVAEALLQLETLEYIELELLVDAVDGEPEAREGLSRYVLTFGDRFCKQPVQEHLRILLSVIESLDVSNSGQDCTEQYTT